MKASLDGRRRYRSRAWQRSDSGGLVRSQPSGRKSLSSSRQRRRYRVATLCRLLVSGGTLKSFYLLQAWTACYSVTIVLLQILYESIKLYDKAKLLLHARRKNTHRLQLWSEAALTDGCLGKHHGARPPQSTPPLFTLTWLLYFAADADR